MLHVLQSEFTILGYLPPFSEHPRKSALFIAKYFITPRHVYAAFMPLVLSSDPTATLMTASSSADCRCCRSAVLLKHHVLLRAENGDANQEFPIKRISWARK